MNLIIHDLNETEWSKISADYEGWEVVSNKGDTKPCVGCFGCWLKTPGKCVIRDGYDNIGELIHKADELVIMSRFTYGGLSSSVKSVVDRCIGYILPFFKMVNGEMHHKPRYPEVKPIRFIFRGSGLTDEDKEKARKYVEAVRTNLNGRIIEIRFDECERSDVSKSTVVSESPAKNGGDDSGESQHAGKTVFINCSMRGDNANSKKFLDVVAEKAEVDAERINIGSYLNKMDELCDKVLSAEKVVLGMPLYVDGIPATPLKLMEMVEARNTGADKKIYVVANMGFFESSQLENLLSMVRTWCSKCGFTYGGGIAIGAGEMMGQVLQFGGNGPGKYVYEAFLQLAAAIKNSEVISDIYTKSNVFPRIAYFVAGNSGMKRSGRNNGLTKKDLMRTLD